VKPEEVMPRRPLRGSSKLAGGIIPLCFFGFQDCTILYAHAFMSRACSHAANRVAAHVHRLLIVSNRRAPAERPGVAALPSATRSASAHLAYLALHRNPSHADSVGRVDDPRGGARRVGLRRSVDGVRRTPDARSG
jgi:hypothetical protein